MVVTEVDLNRCRIGKDFGKEKYSFCATDIPVLLWYGTFFIIFKKQMNKRQQIEFQYLIEQLVHDMALMLMHDFGYDIHEAIDVIYQSEIFSRLEDPNTGLYYQGSVYVYSFLKAELSCVSQIEN